MPNMNEFMVRRAGKKRAIQRDLDGSIHVFINEYGNKFGLRTYERPTGMPNQTNKN